MKCNCETDNGYCHPHKRWSKPLKLTTEERSLARKAVLAVREWRKKEK